MFGLSFAVPSDPHQPPRQDESDGPSFACEWPWRALQAGRALDRYHRCEPVEQFASRIAGIRMDPCQHAGQLGEPIRSRRWYSNDPIPVIAIAIQNGHRSMTA